MSCTSSSSLPSNHWQSSEQTKEKFKFYLSLLSEHNTSSYSCKSRRADDYCSCSIIPKWNIVMIKCHFYSWTNIFFLWYVCICQCQQQHWVWSFSYFLYITRSGCWMSSWSLLYITNIISPWVYFTNLLSEPPRTVCSTSLGLQTPSRTTTTATRCSRIRTSKSSSSDSLNYHHLSLSSVITASGQPRATAGSCGRHVII